ncbi:8856_t:CDS:2 [Dentiscutata erythropus]|uniref:8856_t:CDS:1 n=1 Tax=Dentiscutata erythropus TaxID=1348616 RepID=A0A9N9B2U3_9GLOM|nr:8856_t:CDS:2 [Dentiscutata erythropus]
MESENLTEEEDLDIKNKFLEADSIIKKTELKSLSMLQSNYCSTLIDIQEITKKVVSTQFSGFSGSITVHSASSTSELPYNMPDLLG